MKTLEITEKRQSKLIDDLEKHHLSLWKTKKMNCQVECHLDNPVTAKHRVRRDTYHIGLNGKVVDDIWYEYFCDSCYQEYKDNL